jgi:hypothetical protein
MKTATPTPRNTWRILAHGRNGEKDPLRMTARELQDRWKPFEQLLRK